MQIDLGKNRRQKKHGQNKEAERDVFFTDACLLLHNKSQQKVAAERRGERKSSVYRLGSCFLNFKIIQLGNSETCKEVPKWVFQCFV